MSDSTHFGGGAAQDARSRSSSPKSLSPVLAAELVQAAARDQRKVDVMLMMQNFKLMKSFRPEAVICAFFASARHKTAGVQPRYVPAEWPELNAGIDSPPCVAIGRVINSDVIMTFPGFTPEISAACIAGCRAIRAMCQRRCAPIIFAPFLIFSVILLTACAAEFISRRRFPSRCPTLSKKS